MTAAKTFAEWSASLRPDEVPDEVRRAAKLHILDGVGCAIAAARLGEARFSTAVARSFASQEEATIIAEQVRVPAPAGALANGTLIHALDYDDTHTGALVHATAAVLPAALAVGEECGAPGAEVLAACIVGYEVVIRLGAAVVHGFHARGFHATSVCGVFASALATARLMKLDIDSSVAALGIAGSAASGSLEFLNTGSETKQIHPGLSGMNGIIAARLAAEGAGGPESILEGEHGLFRSYADTQVDPTALTAGLGSRWETTEITIKPYPACQLSHASLDALSSVGDQFAVDEIESITFDIPAESVSIIAGKAVPRSSYEGKFSLPFSAATLLIEGELSVDSFEPDRLTAPATSSLASKIGYASIESGVAPADTPGRVQVRLRDGRTVEGTASKSNLTDEQVRAKFVSNCGDEFDANELASMVLSLEDLDDISSLLAATAPRVLHR